MCDNNSVYISCSKRLQFSCKILLFWFTSCRNRKLQTFLFISTFRRLMKHWDIYKTIYICIVIGIMFKRASNFLLLLLVLIPKHSLPYQNKRIVCKNSNANLKTAFSFMWSSLTPNWFCVILQWSRACILILSNLS